MSGATLSLCQHIAHNNGNVCSIGNALIKIYMVNVILNFDESDVSGGDPEKEPKLLER